MIEFKVDMSYLLEYNELDKVILHDESGEHEPMEFVPKDAATVGNVGYGIQFADWCEFPPETMVGETVFDGEGNAIGWIVNATVGSGTCKRVYHPNRLARNCTCSNCGYGASDERWAYCPKCGHKYVHGEVEERWKRAGRKVAE